MQKISNRKLTLLRKLGRKKYRQEKELFLVEGRRAVRQILQNGSLQVESIFFDESLSVFNEAYWQKSEVRDSSYLVSPDDFREVTDTEHTQGVLALCRIPSEQPVEKLASLDGILVATDAIQDPGNLGTIIRTASWFGAAGLLAGKGTVDVFHPKVVRSTAGATGTLAWRNAELRDDLEKLEKSGWQTCLLDGSAGSKKLDSVNKTSKLIIVVGNEGNGISSELFADHRISIRIDSPASHPPVESLNAAIATSIALYELSKK